MLKNLNIQTSFLIGFGVLLVVGVLVFGGIIPNPKAEQQKAVTRGTVTVWGTIPAETMREITDIAQTTSGTDVKIQYTQVGLTVLDSALTEALAAGTGPDIVLLPEQSIVREQARIQMLPYTAMSERTFRDTFIQEGAMYLRPSGILALPVTVDPMVMYWNRDMFSTKNVVRPPAYWDEFLTLSSVLTERDNANNILKSAISFGDYSNVAHAKDILALLTLQTGNPLVALNSSTGTFSSTLGGKDNETPGFSETLRFYTDFADPLKPVYSWNRSLPNSKDAFLAQDLAVYFGFASELVDIQTKNPNLNFDVAPVPQVRNYPYKTSFAHMQAAAVLKASKQKELALSITMLLSSQPVVDAFSKALLLPPPRLDLLSQRPTDAFKVVFYDSTLTAKSWADPKPLTTDSIFRQAVESVLSGKADVGGASTRVQSEISLLFGEGSLDI